jgi:DNA polymerase-1
MSLDDVRFHLVRSVDDAFDLMRWLSTQTKIAVDTETTGLRPEVDRVRLVQVGDGRDGWVIPWERWSGVFEDIVRRYEGEYVMHNGKYDEAMLASEGVHLPRHRCHDTRILCHLLEPNLPTALKKAASRHVDRRAATLQDRLQTGTWTWETVPLDYEPYWTYAALDTVLTYQLDDVIRPRVLAICPLAYELENSVQWTCAAMERHGAPIDVEYAREKLRDFEAYVKTAETWCVENYSVKPGANAAVVAVLEREGYTFDKTTAAGAKALDKEVLGAIAHPLAQTVLQRRQLQKLASTYLRHFLTAADDPDGVVHPSINTLGARTGRMTIADPPLQTLPRRSDDNPAGTTVRNCVRAREGHVIVSSDFSQIEMRVLAHLAQDPGLIAAFSEGDFFVNLGRQAFNDPAMQKSDPRRQPMKNGMYARAYGAGYKKFALTAGISDEAGQQFYAIIDEAFPGMRRLTDQIGVKAAERLRDEGSAYVQSMLTGRRWTTGDDRDYALINYCIQGTSAELFKMKLLELDAAGVSRYMVAPVHDEIVLEVPIAELEEVTNTVAHCMNDATLLSVPITAEVAFAERWGEIAK